MTADRFGPDPLPKHLSQLYLGVKSVPDHSWSCSRSLLELLQITRSLDIENDARLSKAAGFILVCSMAIARVVGPKFHSGREGGSKGFFPLRESALACMLVPFHLSAG